MNVSFNKRPAVGEAKLMVQDALNNFDTLYKQGQNALGSVPLWLLAQQEHGWERFSRLGLPTRKNEDWKYTSVTGLAKGDFQHAQSDPSLRQQLEPYRKAGAVNLVFNNGIFDVAASDSLASLPAGVSIKRLGDDEGHDPLRLAQLWRQGEQMSDNGFIALNDAMLHEGLVIELAEGIKASRELHLLHVHSPEARQAADEAAMPVAFLRHMIVLERQAELRLWETFVSLPKPATTLLSNADGSAAFLSAATPPAAGMTNAVVDIHLAADARLYHYKLQAADLGHYHLAHVRVWQEEASHYEAFNLSVGARLARHSIDVRQAGSHAGSTLRGLYLGRGSQQSEQRTAIVHAAAGGQSTQYYKGIVDDTARGVFLGQVQVARDAQKIAARQLNKNLLLSPTAEVDTKPVLEIDADDVKCSHGATVSQLREDEIYYLQSRGIRRQTAKAMLARGFADELLFDLDDKDAFAHVQTALSAYFTCTPDMRS